MSDIIDAEVIEVSPPPPQDPVTKAFLPGGPGRRQGSRNRLTSQMLRDYESFLKDFPHASPLVTLARISIGEIFDDEGKKIPVPVSVRAQASAKLASVIMPQSQTYNKFAIEAATIDQRRVVMDRVLTSTPGARGFMEKIAKQIAASMPVGGDSHILPVQPEERGAALTDGRG